MAKIARYRLGSNSIKSWERKFKNLTFEDNIQEESKDRFIREVLPAYSTEEVQTNKVWVDGRPIYQKVIDFGTLPNATTTNVAHEITFITMLNMTGYATNGTAWIPLPYASTSTTALVQLYTSSTNIVITTALDFSAYTETYVILEYVK